MLCRAPDDCCHRCDLLVILEGLHVIAVECDDDSEGLPLVIHPEFAADHQGVSPTGSKGSVIRVVVPPELGPQG